MEFPEDVWKFIFEFIKPVPPKYPYIKELNYIIENRELFFEINPMDYNQHLIGGDDGEPADVYPPSFYECFWKFMSDRKRYLDYHPSLMDDMYEFPDPEPEDLLDDDWLSDVPFWWTNEHANSVLRLAAICHGAIYKQALHKWLDGTGTPYMPNNAEKKLK